MSVGGRLRPATLGLSLPLVASGTAAPTFLRSLSSLNSEISRRDRSLLPGGRASLRPCFEAEWISALLDLCRDQRWRNRWRTEWRRCLSPEHAVSACFFLAVPPWLPSVSEDTCATGSKRPHTGAEDRSSIGNRRSLSQTPSPCSAGRGRTSRLPHISSKHHHDF